MTVASPTRNPWLVLLVLCSGFFMLLLDSTIVNVAIPSIGQSLDSSFDGLLWVINSYLVVYTVMLIPAARLGDRLGQRTVFAIGLAGFLVGSLLSGLSQTAEQLTAARFLQGIGSAVMTPQTLAITARVFPAERRGAAYGVWGAVAGLAAFAGPTLGGFIVTNLDWRWIFFINLPVGVLAMVGTFTIVPPVPGRPMNGWDVPGLLVASTGILAIVFGAIEGQRFNWGTIAGPLSIPALLALGVMLLWAFVFWEGRTGAPLMPPRLFANRDYAIATVAVAAWWFAVIGFGFANQLFLQAVLGMSAQSAGLAVAPLSLTLMVTAPVAGRLADRFGGKYILMLGLAAYAAGISLTLRAFAPGAQWTDFVPGYIVGGFGIGFVSAPSTTVAIRHMPADLFGAASGVLSTARQLGGVLGAAIVGAILQNVFTSDFTQRVSAIPVPAEQRRALAPAAARLATSVTQGLHTEGLSATSATVLHEAYTQAFLAALRPALAVPALLLLGGVVACLWLRASHDGRGEPAPVALQAAIAE